jgi:RNA polymerase sigma-70 factor (ECF subfamily)
MADGTHAPWVAFVAEHWRPLYGYVRGLVRHEQDGEEITQESFYRTFVHWQEFQDATHARRWLYRVASNLCFDRHRRGDRRPRSLDRPGAGGRPSPEVAEEPGLPPCDVLILREALGRLPRHLRAVLFLRYYLEMDRAEIAEVLDRTAAAVNNWLHRGLMKLREMLGDMP